MHDANNTIADIQTVLTQIDFGELIRFQATTVMLAPTVVHSVTTVGLWRLAGSALWTWKFSSLLSFLIGLVQILEGAVDSPLSVMSSDLCPLAYQLSLPNPNLPDSQKGFFSIFFILFMLSTHNLFLIVFNYCEQYSNLLSPGIFLLFYFYFFSTFHKTIFT